MLVKGLGYTALAAAAALLPSVSAAGQSTFVSPNKGLAFAFSVPDSGNEEIYFSMRLKKEYSWGAIGLGSEDMRGALYLIIYRNAKGDNVTFSPRLGYSNMEPKYYDGLQYEVLSGTGISDDHLVFSARCTKKCRAWPSNGKTRSYIDVGSSDQPAIYALGPTRNFASDNQAADLKFHREFGVLSVDMARTQDSKEPPSLNDDSVTDGATMRTHKTAQVNWRTTLHMLCMLISFAGTIPMGVALIKIPKWRKWHAIAQTASLNLVVLGFAMGIVTSGLFQKSHRMNSYHQVIGILVVAFTLIQWSLGYLHHQKRKQTQSSTTYGLIHVWLGRLILLLAMINGFLGFTFAQNKRLLWFMAFAVVITLLSSVGIFYMWKWLDKRRAQQTRRPLENRRPRVHSQHQPGAWGDNPQTSFGDHQPTSWNAVPSIISSTRAPSSSHQAVPPLYEAQQNANHVDIGLQPMSPWNGTPKKQQGGAVELDASQRPVELV